MVDVLEARFRIVTPMFIGGADQDPRDGVRPPSVKGALRFWWRALNWARFRGSTADDGAALRELHQAEASLFGSAADEGRSGQARFHLRVADNSKEGNLPAPHDGHKYMLGMGLVDRKGQYLRKALSGGEFTVRLAFSPSVEDEQKLEVRNALFCWGLLGGLGSRSRRGLGSVSVESITGWGDEAPIPNSVKEVAEALHRLGISGAGSLPPYTAFSRHTRIDASTVGQVAWTLLNDLGLTMRAYRVDQRFDGDRATMLAAVNGNPPTQLPTRAVFGLPHNYFFKSRGRGVAIAPAQRDRTRRASPLFVHAHVFPDANAAIIQSFLPAVFLPDRDVVQIKTGTPNPRTWSVNASTDWGVIRGYLDEFKSRNNLLPGDGGP